MEHITVPPKMAQAIPLPAPDYLWLELEFASTIPIDVHIVQDKDYAAWKTDRSVRTAGFYGYLRIDARFSLPSGFDLGGFYLVFVNHNQEVAAEVAYRVPEPRGPMPAMRSHLPGDRRRGARAGTRQPAAGTR